jgi:DNA-binding PadR family transcriptional regulator
MLGPQPGVRVVSAHPPKVLLEELKVRFLLTELNHIALNSYIMRAKTERGNLWELAVLSLVREEPMHPYQMQRLLRERHKDDVLVLKRGSLYHAINRLVRTGLIEAVTVGRAGRRPERTIYRLTPEGERELVRWLRQRIATVQRGPSEFMGTLSFLVHLPPRDAAAQLEARARALQQQIDGTGAGLRRVGAYLRRIHLIEVEYSLLMLRAELRWVRELLTQLRSGRFTWDLKKILREVRAARRKVVALEGGSE